MEQLLHHRALPFSAPSPFALFSHGGRSARISFRRPAATMYEVLAVAETAGREEIKAAYRREARRWHPDTCRAAGERERFAERFMRAREAYLVLSDPAARGEYDRSLRGGRWRGGGEVSARVGDWRSQLEGLRRRSEWRDRVPSPSWASRMRRGGDADW